MTCRQMTIMLLTAAVLTGCERDNAASRAAIDTKAATDDKIAADRKAASDTKAATDAKIQADLKAAVDSQSAANVKIATDARIAADAKNAADAKTAADAEIAAAAKSATDAKAAADARIAADLAAAKAVADENIAKANALLETLQHYTREFNFEMADATLARLDDMKKSLPASLQTKIDTARVELNAQRATR